MAVHGARRSAAISYETDRVRFIGRGRTLAAPQALTRAGALSGSAGLGARPDRRDPPPHHARAGADRRPSTWSPASPRRARPALALADKYQRPPPRRSRLRPGLDAQPGDAAPAQRHRGRRAALRRASPSSVLYANAALRADAGVLLRNRRGQSGLWGYAHLRRPADRAAADRRRREHRPGAPAGAGARLLAAEGPGGRPGDLERGPRRLPADAAGPDHGPDRRRHRGAA